MLPYVFGRESRNASDISLEGYQFTAQSQSSELGGQDYETVQVKNIDQLYKGKTELILEDPSIIAKLYEKGKLNPEELMEDTPPSNHFCPKSRLSALGWYNSNSGFIENIEIKIHGIH